MRRRAGRDADRRQVERLEREIAGVGARLKETCCQSGLEKVNFYCQVLNIHTAKTIGKRRAFAGKSVDSRVPNVPNALFWAAVEIDDGEHVVVLVNLRSFPL